MKTLELASTWFNKIWPWVVIPILFFGAILVGIVWGEAKKALRS
jgi:hypothetical protein